MKAKEVVRQFTLTRRVGAILFIIAEYADTSPTFYELFPEEYATLVYHGLQLFKIIAITQLGFGRNQK